MNSRQQGAIGVAQAIAYFTDQLYPVFVPLSENQRYDLVVEINGALQKIECKTSTYQRRESSWAVTLDTAGGNQSWDGVRKPLSSDDADYVFIYAGERKWLIPTSEVEDQSTVTVGNKAWGEYEL